MKTLSDWETLNKQAGLSREPKFRDRRLLSDRTSFVYDFLSRFNHTALLYYFTIGKPLFFEFVIRIVNQSESDRGIALFFL